jgi:ribonuclease R
VPLESTAILKAGFAAGALESMSQNAGSATSGREDRPAMRRAPIRRFSDIIVHRALLHEIGAADDPLPEDLSDLAEHVSGREREIAEIECLADDICLAWLLERVLFEHGWDESFEGEITGVIPSGLFVRFGDVFEGLLPA